MVQGLVFDMDGLIFDSERVVQRSWNIAGKELGYERFGEYIYQTIGFNVTRRIRFFLETVGSDFPYEEFNIRTREIFCEIVDQEGLGIKPGAKELIIYAKKQGYRLAVATSSRREYAIRNLKESNLFHLFDGMVCGDMVQNAKPDPEIYLMASKLIGLAPQNCLALEDAPAGVRAAAAAGMPVIVIPDLVWPDDEIRALATFQLNSLNEVMELMRKKELPF